MLDLILPLFFHPVLTTPLDFQHLAKLRLVTLVRDRVGHPAGENWLAYLLESLQLLDFVSFHPSFMQDGIHNWYGSVHI